MIYHRQNHMRVFIRITHIVCSQQEKWKSASDKKNEKKLFDSDMRRG